MKTYLLPTATALLGFALAWLAKPDDDVSAPDATPVAGVTAPDRNARSGPASRPSGSGNRSAPEVNASDFPLADAAAQGPKTREEAKMLRLSEALGLAVDQQGTIISLIEEVQANVSETTPVIEDLANRGRAVEEGLQATLTPEQMEKFREIQERERENLIEVRAQKMLTAAISEIDLSPAQRDEVLARLRQKARMDLQAIPAAAALLFDTSLLPVGDKELSVDGVLAVAKMGEEVVYDDPMVAHQKVVENHRRELEETLRCFDGILTPGQMGQYQAALAEQQALMQRLPREIAQKNAETLPEPPAEEGK